ncbi:MAG: FG-GAP-like repeat-containing protein [Bacteroidota bacterium]
MKQILPFVLLSLLAFPLFGQNPSWFTDVTGQVGLSTTPAALRLNVVDINGDQYPDIVTVRTVNQRDMINVWLNTQDSTTSDPQARVFIDWTDSSGVNVHQDYPDSTRRSEIVCLADVDNDGDADLVSGIWHWDPTAVNFPNDRSSVMLNDGTGRFTHVANNGFESLGFISIAGLSFLDYNLDGNLDVWVATFSDDHPNNDFRRDHLMIGNGDGTFTDRPSPFDLNTWLDPEYGASVTDWDNDCYQDIMTSPYCRSGGALWRNLNGGAFQNVASSVNYNAQFMQGDTNQGIARDLCQWGAYPYDFDNDGDMDVFHSLVHGGLEATEGRSTIAVNSGPANNYQLTWELNRLVRQNPQSPHMGNMDATWIDIDNNMLTDLVVTETEYVPSLDRVYFYIQDSAHFFLDQTPQLQLMNYKPHSIESVDYDLDGDFDLVFNDRDDGTQVRIWRNEIGNQNNWIGFDLLPPPTCNADAIGARIQVYSGGVAQMNEIQAGLGHWGGQAPFLRMFGLAQNAVVDSVVVRWPMQGCQTTTIYNPPINTVNEITVDGLVVGIEAPKPGFELYPNPAQGSVTVRGEMLVSPSAELQVFDLLGNRVTLQGQEQLAENAFRFRVDVLPAGVYVVRITDAQLGESWTKKLVVE